MSLLIRNLTIVDKQTKLVDISFNIEDSVALVGESGSGKSLTLKSILGLTPNNLDCNLNYDCSFDLNNTNISFIPQNPFTAFSPLTKIKNQFFAPYEQQVQLLKKVDLSENCLEKFPSQLSGGQLQRLLFAMAMSKNPKLLLLDEPTTALDESNKKNILRLIEQIKNEFKSLILFVTHDIFSIENLCKNIVIIKNGLIQEEGLTTQVLKNPKHEYTNLLIEKNFKNRGFRL